MISIQHEDFDCGEEIALIKSAAADEGAIAVFVGNVRCHNEGDKIIALELEHYPGMTEKSLRKIVAEAKSRWSILAARVIHRVGKLSIGEQIVFVGVSSAHRKDAFHACEFIMDFLKTEAPFWKKEYTESGQRWIDARDSDVEAAENWE